MRYLIADKNTTEKTESYGHNNSEKCVIYSLIIQKKCDMLLAYWRKAGESHETQCNSGTRNMEVQ